MKSGRFEGNAPPNRVDEPAVSMTAARMAVIAAETCRCNEKCGRNAGWNLLDVQNVDVGFFLRESERTVERVRGLALRLGRKLDMDLRLDVRLLGMQVAP